MLATTATNKSSRTAVIAVFLLALAAAMLLAPRPALAVVSTLHGVAEGTWSATNVTFTLTTDKDGEPGLISYYRLSSEATQTYSGPVTVSNEGATLLGYFSYCPA